MHKSSDGAPLDLSDLILSASTPGSTQKQRPETRLSPKSLAAQIIHYSSDSSDEAEAESEGQSRPSVKAAGASPAYSDQSSIDQTALEKSLLEHPRSTSPPAPADDESSVASEEILSDISAHSEDSVDEDGHGDMTDLVASASRRSQDETSLSQTELDAILSQLRSVEEEENEEASNELERDMKAMAALARVANQAQRAPMKDHGSPSRQSSVMSREESASGLVALRELIKDALECHDIATVQTVVQQVVTLGRELREDEREALKPDVERLVAAAHQMERTAEAGRSAEGEGDQDYPDDFEEDDQEASGSGGATAAGTARQRPQSAPVTPSIDPVQTSPSKKELLAGLGEADNAFAAPVSLPRTVVEQVVSAVHKTEQLDEAFKMMAQEEEGRDEAADEGRVQDLAHDIAQSLSDSGAWSDDLSALGSVDPSDEAISRYIRDLFEWLQANHKPENGATSHSEIAHSLILPESRLPNRQLFVGYERERERKAAEEAAATMPDSAHGDAEHGASANMPIVTEEQQMHHLAIFDACAEVVRAPLPSMPASLSLRR